MPKVRARYEGKELFALCQCNSYIICTSSIMMMNAVGFKSKSSKEVRGKNKLGVDRPRVPVNATAENGRSRQKSAPPSPSSNTIHCSSPRRRSPRSRLPVYRPPTLSSPYAPCPAQSASSEHFSIKHRSKTPFRKPTAQKCCALRQSSASPFSRFSFLPRLSASRMATPCAAPAATVRSPAAHPATSLAVRRATRTRGILGTTSGCACFPLASVSQQSGANYGYVCTGVRADR